MIDEWYGILKVRDIIASLSQATINWAINHLHCIVYMSVVRKYEIYFECNFEC